MLINRLKCTVIIWMHIWDVFTYKGENMGFIIAGLIISFFIIGLTSEPKKRKMTIKEENEYLLK